MQFGVKNIPSDKFYRGMNECAKHSDEFQLTPYMHPPHTHTLCVVAHSANSRGNFSVNLGTCLIVMVDPNTKYSVDNALY